MCHDNRFWVPEIADMHVMCICWSMQVSLMRDATKDFHRKGPCMHVQGSSYSNLIAINGSNTSNLCLMMMSCSWSQWHTEYRNRFRCLYTDPHEGKNKKSVLFILGFPEIILSHNTKFLWLQQRFLCQSQAKSWDSKQFV